MTEPQKRERVSANEKAAVEDRFETLVVDSLQIRAGVVSNETTVFVLEDDTYKMIGLGVLSQHSVGRFRLWPFEIKSTRSDDDFVDQIDVAVSFGKFIGIVWCASVVALGLPLEELLKRLQRVVVCLHGRSRWLRL